MPRKGLFIDTNLLLLYVVGRTGRQYITKHRRGGPGGASLPLCHADGNLQPQHGEPERSLFTMLDPSEPSCTRLGIYLNKATQHWEELRGHASADVDVELYIAALAKGNEAAINFTTFRRL